MSFMEMPFVRRSRRTSTIEAYESTVAQVVARMRERPDAPLDLAGMAACVAVSRSHFDRVFREVTGLSPRHFQAAVRLRAATHLILTTRRRITDVCFDVGYESLGTFVTRFTQSFGVSPMRLRSIIPDLECPLAALLPRHRPIDMPPMGTLPRRHVRGVASSFDGIAFIGLFRERIADHAPEHCAIAAAPGPFVMPDVADGAYWVMAISLRPDRRAIDVLLDDDIPRAAMPSPVNVADGIAERDLALEFRGASPVDPPVNLVLPLLMRIHEQRMAQTVNRREATYGSQGIDSDGR
jgi:AraC-like DNA-binding protein